MFLGETKKIREKRGHLLMTWDRAGREHGSLAMEVKFHQLEVKIAQFFHLHTLVQDLLRCFGVFFKSVFFHKRGSFLSEPEQYLGVYRSEYPHHLDYKYL